METTKTEKSEQTQKHSASTTTVKLKEPSSPELHSSNQKLTISTTKNEDLKDICSIILSSQPVLPYGPDPAPITMDIIPKSENLSFDTKTIEAYKSSIINTWRTMEIRAEAVDRSEIRMEIVHILIIATIKLGVPIKALFYAVSLLDRYIQLREGKDDSIVLTGLACLSLSAKIESEARLPRASDFVSIVNDKYTADELIARETEILGTVDLVFVSTAVVDFLKLWMSGLTLDEKTSSYLIFLSICSQLSPDVAIVESELVAASVLALGLSTFGLSLDVAPLQESMELFGKKKIEKCSVYIRDAVLSVQNDTKSPTFELFSETIELKEGLRINPKLPEFKK